MGYLKMEKNKELIVPVWMEILYVCGRKKLGIAEVSKIIERTYGCVFYNINVLKKYNFILLSMRDKKTSNIVLTETGAFLHDSINSIFNLLNIDEDNLKQHTKQKRGVKDV